MSPTPRPSNAPGSAWPATLGPASTNEICEIHSPTIAETASHRGGDRAQVRVGEGPSQIAGRQGTLRRSALGNPDPEERARDEIDPGEHAEAPAPEGRPQLARDQSPQREPEQEPELETRHRAPPPRRAPRGVGEVDEERRPRRRGGDPFEHPGDEQEGHDPGEPQGTGRERGEERPADQKTARREPVGEEPERDGGEHLGPRRRAREESDRPRAHRGPAPRERGEVQADEGAPARVRHPEQGVAEEERPHAAVWPTKSA